MLQRRVTGLTVFPGIGEESVLLAGGGGGEVTGDMWRGCVRSKVVTGLAVLPRVNGEVTTCRVWLVNPFLLVLIKKKKCTYYVEGVVR